MPICPAGTDRRHIGRHRKPARCLHGSFIIGFIYTFGTALFPELAYIILFLPMIFVIAFRPQGLFGRLSA
jgi:branched-subunit amino acid ABC-type transport system permease component